MKTALLFLVLFYGAHCQDRIHPKESGTAGEPQAELMIQRLTLPVQWVGGLYWNDDTKILAYPDVLAGTYHMWTRKTGKTDQIYVQDLVGKRFMFAIPIKGKAGSYVAAADGALRIITRSSSGTFQVSKPVLQLNDTNMQITNGHCDSKGRLFFGTRATLPILGQAKGTDATSNNCLSLLHKVGPDGINAIVKCLPKFNKVHGTHACIHSPPKLNKVDGIHGRVNTVAKLYKVENGEAQVVHTGGTSINDLMWSVDFKQLYVIADGRTIWQYSYDVDKGTLGDDPKEAFNIIDHPMVGTEMTSIETDDNGTLWVTATPYGILMKIFPKTKIIDQTIKLPVDDVTSCTFGGYKNRNLYIGTKKSSAVTRLGEGSVYVVSGFSTYGTYDRPVVWPN